MAEYKRSHFDLSDKDEVSSLHEEIIMKYVDANNSHAKRLKVVTYGVSPEQIKRDLEIFSKKNISLDLIIGQRTERKKLERVAKFQALEKYYSCFKCYYWDGTDDMHSKVFSWNPLNITFIGSANYSIPAMVGAQKNCMLEDTSSHWGSQYFDSLMEHCIPCGAILIPEDLKYHEANLNIDTWILRIAQKHSIPSDTPRLRKDQAAHVAHCSLRTHDGCGGIHQASGLNWGQGSTRVGRDSNQAYISIPSRLYKEHWFGRASAYIRIFADDGEEFIMRLQGDRGKQMSTPRNDQLGCYFRKRLGVQAGDAVTMQDLNRYGRDYISFYKFDIEGDMKTFFLDFSSDSPSKMHMESGVTSECEVIDN